MKEFRVARCLDKDGIHEYAIFADGSRKKPIQNDETYGKFFTVDNELNPNGHPLLRRSFTGRIKDAVETIRNGNGDCLKVTSMFGKHESVCYFLDRKVGEELRQKSIEGWKDTKFGYAITAGSKESFSGYSLLNSKNAPVMFVDSDESAKPMVFSTEEDATDYINSLINQAWAYANQLSEKIMAQPDESARDAIFEEIMSQIDAENSRFSIIEDFLYDMLNDDLSLKTETPKLDKMGWKIVQCCTNN